MVDSVLPFLTQVFVCRIRPETCKTLESRAAIVAGRGTLVGAGLARGPRLAAAGGRGRVRRRRRHRRREVRGRQLRRWPRLRAADAQHGAAVDRGRRDGRLRVRPIELLKMATVCLLSQGVGAIGLEKHNIRKKFWEKQNQSVMTSRLYIFFKC